MKRTSGRASSPDDDLYLINDSSSTPSSSSSAECSFRELDDEFLQTQTRIWLGEVLHLRFDEGTSIADLLADGEVLFQLSKVVWEMMLTKCVETKYLKTHIYEPTAFGKSGGRYLPYSNVDAFLKICQMLGLTGVDLFTPSDVVEKRDIRRVCMCIRSLSKKARSKHLEVPDFDIVTYTITMPTDMVGCIRRSLERSQSSSSSSVGCSSCMDLKDNHRKNSWGTVNTRNGQLDLALEEFDDDAESNFRVVDFQSPDSNICYEDGCSPCADLQVEVNFETTAMQFHLATQEQHEDPTRSDQSAPDYLLVNGNHQSSTLCLECQVDPCISKASCADRTRVGSPLRTHGNGSTRFVDHEIDYASSVGGSPPNMDRLFAVDPNETFSSEMCNDSTCLKDRPADECIGFSEFCGTERVEKWSCIYEISISKEADNAIIEHVACESTEKPSVSATQNVNFVTAETDDTVSSVSRCQCGSRGIAELGVFGDLSIGDVDTVTNCFPSTIGKNSTRTECIDMMTSKNELKPKMDLTELLDVYDASLSTTGLNERESPSNVQSGSLEKENQNTEFVENHETNTTTMDQSNERQTVEEVHCSKPNSKKQILSSVAGGMAIFGALFFLLHLRKGASRKEDTSSGSSSSSSLQIQKPSTQKSTSEKGLSTIDKVKVYPGERLKL